MKKPFGPGIGLSSARADTFRPSLGADHGSIRRMFKERRNRFAVRMERQWKSPSDQALADHPRGRTRSAPPWVPITTLFVSRITFLSYPPRKVNAPCRVGSRMWKVGLGWLVTCAWVTGGLAEKPHPRLWFPKSAEEGLRQKLASDPLAARLHDAVMGEARRVLTSRTCRYEIPDGKRLLAESRLALRNTFHCAWAWRMSGEEKFRLRAIAELEAACHLKDWNPSHFLDTAEMATAVAVGYDWLYPGLSAEQRGMCEVAIIEKALRPAKKIYDSHGWWTKPSNNWAQVCGAGIAIAAVAIAGNDSGLSEELFAQGQRLVDSCAKFYAPDGMYPEGPGYWHYGTNYHTMLLAASQGLGNPNSEIPLLQKAGCSIMHLVGPTGIGFNFADSQAHPEVPSPAQCWLAGRFHDKVQAGYIRDYLTRRLVANGKVLQNERCAPLFVLWLPEAQSAPAVRPLAAAFRGEQAVAAFRTSWDASATFIAIKGGTPAASHGHMDVGSFVYDAHGLRWICDLGSDNYNLPGYFGKNRWSYFRLQNLSHNTLEIKGHLQNDESPPCPLTSSTLTGDLFTATFDLTGAYSEAAEKVIRSVCFDAQRGSAVLQDQITKPSGVIVWRAWTDAEAEVAGDRVILKKQGRQIVLKRLSHEGDWSIADAKPPGPEEKSNAGFRAVVLTVPQQKSIKISVEIQP
jgi:Heparinase II/III-like protein